MPSHRRVSIHSVTMPVIHNVKELYKAENLELTSNLQPYDDWATVFDE